MGGWLDPERGICYVGGAKLPSFLTKRSHPEAQPKTPLVPEDDHSDAVDFPKGSRSFVLLLQPCKCIINTHKAYHKPVLKG